MPPSIFGSKLFMNVLRGALSNRDTEYKMNDNTNRFDNALAALGSALLPGLGQAFESRWHAAMLFFLGAAISYVLFMPLGIIVHIWSIFDAAFYNRRRKYDDNPDGELRT